MYIKRLQIFLFYQIIILLLGISKAQWIEEIQYNKNNCEGRDGIIRVSAYYSNTCYSVSETYSFKYYILENKIIVREVFTKNKDCSGTSTQTKNNLNQCTNFVIYKESKYPPAAAVDYASLERPPINLVGCSIYESSRHHFPLGTCSNMPDFPSSFSYFLRGDDNSVYGELYSTKCDYNNQSKFDKCNFGDEKMLGIKTPKIKWNLPSPVVSSQNIQVPSFEINWNHNYKYNIFYYNEFFDSFTIACQDISNKDGCTFKIPAGISKTRLLYTLLGDTIISNPVNTTTDEIVISSSGGPPTMTKLTSSYTTKSVTLEYEATSSPSSYYITLNNVYQPICSKINKCTIDSLTPGSQVTIGAYATNSAGNSIPKTILLTLYPSVSIVTITLLDLYPNQLVVFFTTTGGVPNQTFYSATFGNLGCIDILASNCTISGLSSNYTGDLVVSAKNDGLTQSITRSINFQPPSVALSLVKVTTSQITFSYMVDDTSATMSVYYNGVPFTDICNKVGCQLINLNPGSFFNITVIGKNKAGTSFDTITGNLYETISNLTLKATPNQFSIQLEFNTTGGIPQETSYVVYVDDVIYKVCSNILENICTINNIPQHYSYQVKVIASNDNAKIQNSTFVKYLLPEINKFGIDRLTTKSIVFSYSASNEPSTFNVYINSFNIYYCSTNNTCQVDNMIPGSKANISVSANNNAGTSLPTSMYISLYRSVSNLVAKAIKTKDIIEVEYESSDGVPNETTYTTKINNVNVVGCVDIKDLKCIIQDKQNSVSSITVVATNDGDSKSTTTLVIPDEPEMISLSLVDKTSNSIRFKYLASSFASYNVLFNGLEHRECSKTTICTIRNLLGGANYLIQVSATNSAGTSEVLELSGLLPSSNKLF